MRHLALVAPLLVCVVACDNVKTTPLPRDIKGIDAIRPQLDKLDSADRARLGMYFMRHTIGTAFGGEGIPAGMTIGKAIQEENEFEAKTARAEAESKALAVKTAAERAQRLQLMNQILTVGLEHIGLQSDDEYGISKSIGITLAFQNKTAKAIAGVKGTAVFRDIFGDTIQAKRVSYDDGIPPNVTREWHGSAHYNQFTSEDVKLATTGREKIRFSFDPSVIIFSDGSKLEAPEL